MRRKPIVAVVAAVALVATSTALADLTNGGFESGNFDDWERTEKGAGDWVIYDENEGLDPPEGAFAAKVTQGEPGYNLLHRDLTAKDGRFLSFQLAYESSTNRFFTPRTFKFNDDDLKNQQARVDLLRRDAEIKSLKKSDILATPFRTKKDSSTSESYQLFVVDLKEENIKGRFRFRIAEVDNRGEFFVGLDNVVQSDLAP